MRMRVKSAICIAVAGVAATTAVAIGSDAEKLRTDLTGVEETPAAVITDGNGTFTAGISRSEQRIDYELSFEGLEGGETRQAHIHVGQRTASGGISAWLCDSPTNPSPASVDVETCPASGTVTGTIEPADVQAIATQGFRPDPAMTADQRFDKLVRALRSGLAYANVHTATSPAGEIRGQIEHRQDD
jgi:CHRD domain